MARKKTHAEFVKQIEHLPFEAIGRYDGYSNRILFRCKNHGVEWITYPGRIIEGGGCRKCGYEKVSESNKRENEIIEDNGDWLLIDISTPKYIGATMAVDSDVWNGYTGGRVFAEKTSAKYIYARYNDLDHVLKLFHRYVITDSKYLDHIVHGTMNFIDNRASNLRPATDSQNMMNKSLHKNNTSGKKGVCLHKLSGKWTATIRVNKKSKHLGSFPEKEDAIAAREIAEERHYGEYLLKPNKGVAI